MSNQNFITIPIGGREPREYLADLHESLTVSLGLIFSHRELYLQPNHTFALFILTELLGLVVAQEKQR